MKATFSVNMRKLQVSHMCTNTLFSTALYKEADLHFCCRLIWLLPPLYSVPPTGPCRLCVI